MTKTWTDAEKRAAKLNLPEAPASERGAVKVWEQDVEMLSYMPKPADVNPMFLKRRVYQGSNGEVYPLPFIDRIESEPQMRAWKAVHLENETLRLMVMPEIGGRIHIGMDKVNGYDFFYRQNVIKPALVGLAGPWISGGVEFNWPQHHRPQTFMPVETDIERHNDGSVTVWCSDYDRASGMKGMHGVCLHPGRAVVELKARLYNGTERVQTFLWWANVAAKVHEDYQSFFPPDVRFVADHAKRAVSTFPLADASYYGVNYGLRGKEGVPVDDAPANFVPRGEYAANDLSRYANIPVPTSYMIVQTEGEFFGGYDHAADAGFVHVANRHISPGKKQWTWGNHEFGYAWDRALAENDGPYVELMAGVYTDNQPDFSFLLPGETKTFSQFWWPLRKMGVPRAANLDAALHLEARDGVAHIGVNVTRDFASGHMALRCGDAVVKEWAQSFAVTSALVEDVALPAGCDAAKLVLTFAAEGAETLAASLAPAAEKPAPAMAFEPPEAETVDSADKLYLIGLHLEQYRHPSRSPERYWQEALQRDAGDVRSNHALAKLYWKRGEYERALSHARTAVERATWLNPNPQDGEVFYTLGLVLRTVGRVEEAYAAFYKSTWNFAWRTPAYYAIAEIDAAKGELARALEHVQLSLRTNTDHLNARNLCVALMKRLGVPDAETLLKKTRTLDPLDHWSRWMDTGVLPEDGHQVLALGMLLERCGFVDDAIAVLSRASFAQPDGSEPLIHLALARCYETKREAGPADAALDAATKAPTTYCFPNGAEQRALLEFGLAKRPESARLHYYFGNLMFQAGQPDVAIEAWERAVKLEGAPSQAWRNLGIASFNVRHDAAAAQRAFARAAEAAPADARILYERDQLRKRVGEKPEERLAELLRHRELVRERDDLSVELATLLNQVARPEEALEILLSRPFQPWEGGEGLVLAQFVRAKLSLGQKKLAGGDAAGAAQDFAETLTPPRSLGEAKHLLHNRADVYFWMGEAAAARGDDADAKAMYARSVQELRDPQQTALRPFSEMTYWSGMALLRMGRDAEAKALFADMTRASKEMLKTTPKIDYFATSLPNLLLFDDDLMERQRVHAGLLEAYAALGTGDENRARTLFAEMAAADPNVSSMPERRPEMADPKS